METLIRDLERQSAKTESPLLMRALKVGVRRSASDVTVLTPATFANWPHSKKISPRIKSKSSQMFIRTELTSR